MSRLTQQEIRNNATAFFLEWKGESRERAEMQLINKCYALENFSGENHLI